jgi:hypothetical protein
MTPSVPDTETRQTSLKGLKLPITVEHFRSLARKEQNALIAEQIMGWQLYEWEDECSQFTPSAEWQYGSDYYAQKCTLWAPTHLDNALEDDEEALTHWEEAYDSREWLSDIGAAMKLLEPLQDRQPAVCKYTPSVAVPWAWYCYLIDKDKTAVWGHGATDFAGLPEAIAVTCLLAVGAIDNSPLACTPAVEEQVLQAAQLGPLAGVPGNRVNSRFCHQSRPGLSKQPVVTQDGEETNGWLTQYRNGHYVFHAV